MATPRRRSARLSKAAQQRSSPRKTPSATVQLESLIERDESLEVSEPQSIDNVPATLASSPTIQFQLSRLSSLKTPQTEPRADRGEMHPKFIHRTTTKAPDSGLKLGFGDIPPHPFHSLASAQNTPSKARLNTPANLSSTNFGFKFGSNSQLSSEAQKLMDSVREEAARIKAQMHAEREAQQQRDDEAEATFNGVTVTDRKIAKPKGKAGRFSDIHMAQFKKMDSIANHPSAYRAKSSFAQSTAQSLKRSGSKAGLNEVDRPRTAGKGTPGRLPPAFLGRATSVSPFKSIPARSERIENMTPAKRARHSEFHDVSASRPSDQVKSTVLPKPALSSLWSPTKASLARAAASQIPFVSPNKAPALRRPTSVQTLGTVSTIPNPRPSTAHGEATTQALSKMSYNESSRADRPLPPLPKDKISPHATDSAVLQRSKSTTELASVAHAQGVVARLSKPSGQKSVLRSGRKAEMASSIKGRPGTPKRPNTATSANGSAKKVDFTPSVKSRYAVRLAAGSPSPAKLPPLTPRRAPAPVVPYEPAAYILQDDDAGENWDGAGSEIEYPTLPDVSSSPAPPRVESSFAENAKDHNRRESQEFKSIFTTLHHPSRPNPPSTLASVNTIVNKTNPTFHTNNVMRSPSNAKFVRPSPTIRRVRSSDVSNLIQPFEDTKVNTVPHGLPGKKRRRESAISDDPRGNDDDAKENRGISVLPALPGGWQESPQVDGQGEGEKRGGKRVRVETGEDSDTKPVAQKLMSETKKARPSSTRAMAKNNAKERKGRGALSLSRLNMLSQPKQRG
ncbi:uncharacterized protein Z518_04265 [Rhinocladiella mackenziei CBS 650.93]|uniref:Erythromycin esterase n=1 Tax=Rhinocladiella mackenziei CBS 650.93 TaxID=1442369 RepID=A0A0D2JB05_9EURO|nr:uncharacterized protein Z518_04265 [Rhinocladiella mackenziei CBS 650.93]KIX06290.1 hypothetical protein Z518_04265 [Rhinocladiella mackenziei CBS 650.93]